MIKAVSITKARRNFGWLLDEVSTKGHDYIITRRGKPLGVLISVEKYPQLQQENENSQRK